MNHEKFTFVKLLLSRYRSLRSIKLKFPFKYLKQKFTMKAVAVKMEKELNSCVVVFELLGLQYFSLKSLTADSLRSRPSVFRALYMILWLFLTTSLMIIYIIHDHSLAQGSLTAKNVLMYAIQHTMNVGLILVAITSLIQSMTSTRNIKKFFLNIHEIFDLYLYDFKIPANLKSIKRSSWRRMTLMLMYYLTIHGGFMSLHAPLSDAAYKMLFGMLPILFLVMIVYKFVFYVGIINRQLKFLNKLLEDNFLHQPIKMIDNMKFHLTTVKPVKSPDDNLKKLRSLRKIYNVIFENAAIINDSIGLTVLMLLVCLVISLTVAGYQVFVIVIGGLPATYVPSN